MGISNEVAVIIARRRAKNWILHTRGIDAKHVLQTSQDVVSHLDRAYEHVRSGAQAATSYGQVSLTGTSFTAVYRVVNQIVIITLAQSNANIFNSINLLATISRLLLHELRGGEAAIDKLSVRKMSQIYLAVDSMMVKGHTELHPPVIEAQALMEGSLRSRGAKSPKDAPTISAVHAPLGTKRKLSQQGNLMQKFSFTPPQEILDLPAPPEPTTSSMAADPLSALPLDGLVPGTTGPNDPFAASAGLLPTDPNDPFGLSAGPAGQAPDIFALDGLAAGMQGPGGLPLPDGFEPSQWSARQSQDGGPVDVALAIKRLSTAGLPPPGGLPMSAQQPVSGLLVKEVWRGEVEGSQLVRAGITGHVQWASEDARSLSPSLTFALLAPEFPDSFLKQALKCARLNRAAAAPGPTPRTFIAQSAAATPASAPMLLYQLPASFCKPPLNVQPGFTCLELASGSSLVLIGLQFALDPHLAYPMQGMLVDVVVPPGIKPLKMDPVGQWSPAQRAARFMLPNVLPGHTGSVAALFNASMGIAATFKALKSVRLSARIIGTPGHTFSGLSLRQGSMTQPLAPTEQACAWEAHITASLAVPDSPFVGM